MAERIRILAVAAKVESTYGTDSAPSLVTNAVRPIGIPLLAINYLDIGSRKDEQFAGLGIMGQNAFTGRWGQVDITLGLKGGGADYFTAANRPECDAFLQAAGFSVSEVGGSGSGTLIYTTLDTGTFSSLTLYLYAYNKLIKMTGVVCAPKIKLEAAKRGEITFTCFGMIATDPTESTVGAVTLNTVVEPIFSGQTVSIGAFNSTTTPGLIARKLNIDMGTAHVPRPSAGATDGIAGFLITDRMVKCQAELEVVPLSTFNPYTLVKGGYAIGGALTTNVSVQLGSVQFNKVQILTGQWVFNAPKHSDASGLVLWTLDGDIMAQSITGPQGTGREIALYFT